jgi:hypothetical protein
VIHYAILIALIGASPQGPRQTSAADSSNIVVIDGSKNPSMLPEWLVWEQAFLIVAGWRGRDSGITHDLRMALSKDEVELLEREAAMQSERQNQAGREAEPLRARYATRDPKDEKLLALLNDQMQNVNLRYRRATLEARNRVLERLSLESQSVLTSWIGDIRAGIVSRVAKADLERWRAPE